LNLQPDLFSFAGVCERSGLDLGAGEDGDERGSFGGVEERVEIIFLKTSSYFKEISGNQFTY
jgi:hypothetical protein